MSDTIIAAIITGIVTLVVGFLSGKAYESHKTIEQTQKSGKNSSQIQIGVIEDGRKED